MGAPDGRIRDGQRFSHGRPVKGWMSLVFVPNKSQKERKIRGKTLHFREDDQRGKEAAWEEMRRYALK